MNAIKHLRDIEQFCREVISGESKYADSTAEVAERVLYLAKHGNQMCAGGCGLAYKDFGFDVLLPDGLWGRIINERDETDKLCAGCIVKRLAKLDIRVITALRLIPIERDCPICNGKRVVTWRHDDGDTLTGSCPECAEEK